MSGERILRYGYRGGITDPDLRLRYQNGGEPKYLLPCQRIEDPEVLVGILAYNTVHPKWFIPTHKDKHKISLQVESTGEVLEVAYPGKSAFLYFEDVPTRETLGEIVNQSLNRIKKRSDHLHLSTVGWIQEAGWQVWWTPLPERNHWLHVRLVPGSVIERGVAPSLEEAAALRAAFIRAV